MSLVITTILRLDVSSLTLSCDSPIILNSIGDELKRTVSIVVDLASVLDPNGVDVYFLNREPIRNVRHSSELTPVFAVPPEGRFVFDRSIGLIL